jgi:hypothetical protein
VNVPVTSATLLVVEERDCRIAYKAVEGINNNHPVVFGVAAVRSTQYALQI